MTLRFLIRAKGADCDPQSESMRVAQFYEEVAIWLEDLASEFDADGARAFARGERLLIDKMMVAPAASHRASAGALREEQPGLKRIGRGYRRLAGLLNVEITSFERKQFANLSHRSNKAMNLNSYIGFIGKSFRVRDV